jgi:thiaminase
MLTSFKLQKEDFLIYKDSFIEVKNKFLCFVNNDFYQIMIKGDLDIDKYKKFLEYDITFLTHKINFALDIQKEMNFRNKSLKIDSVSDIADYINNGKTKIIDEYFKITNKNPQYIRNIGFNDNVLSSKDSIELNILGFAMSSIIFYFLMQHNENFYQNKLHDNIGSFFDIVFSSEWICSVELAIFRMNGLYKNMNKDEKLDALRIFDNFLNLEINFLDKILKNL